MTKIDIISGFLGAGKTTLIKKLLKEALAGTNVYAPAAQYSSLPTNNVGALLVDMHTIFLVEVHSVA